MVDLNTQGFNINRVQAHRYRFRFNGLLPNTKHTLYVDGVNYNAVSRQSGKNFGEDLISDENGYMIVTVLYEIPYNRNSNFELPQTTTLAFQEEVVNNQNSKDFRLVENYVVFEVKSASENSYAQYVMPMPILLTAGGVNTLYPID